MTEEIKNTLIELANKYEVTEFVNEDPSQFLRWYDDVRDVEIASFIAEITHWCLRLEAVLRDILLRISR